MCKEKAEWDDPLNPQLDKQWQEWKDDLENLDKVNIDRCIKPAHLGQLKHVELHHFSDASLNGLGQCTYLRVVDIHDNVHCTLLSAKSRVASIKPITVPRSELMAAVLSAKMAEVVAHELDMEITAEHFWCDSKVVLGYIQNQTKKFQPFVANRVQQIVTKSEPSQWHYVQTSENPADLASRGCNINKLIASDWFKGPRFLWQTDISSLVENTASFELDLSDPEVKSCLHTNATVHVNEAQSLSLTAHVNRFSSLQTAVKAVCTSKRLLKHRKSKQLPKASVHDLEQAKSTIMRWVQKDAFAEDLEKLAKQGCVDKHSPLAKLDPFLDDDGLIRVGGRLKESELDFCEKHPLILPKKSHVTMLVIRECHEKVVHQGKGLTVSEIKSSGYYIIGCLRAVNSYIHNCIVCKKQRQSAMGQKMADLPKERLTPAPPFTYVGCDVFGPFIVKDRRTELKKYGLIFTCMASRSIHIEMLDNMTTDAFINALRCLIAIRGPVRQIRSDCGTNFIGVLKEFDVDVFSQENKIDFVTNVPNASHMGGVWERQIRTIRSALNSMLAIHKCRLDSTTLRTFFYEVMAIINGRPLNALDDNNTPLTPNQLLTMKSKIICPPPGQFDDSDVYSKKRWRRVQGLANLFWSKWKNQYLQNLQPRQKWLKAQNNVQVGDIVLLKNDQLHRNEWPLARVVELHDSRDDLVRKAKVQLATAKLDSKGKRLHPPTQLERPIHKLVYLFTP
jgi:hypothetical protein